MMKKIISLSAIAAGVMLSGHAMAATAYLGKSTTVTPVHCPALSNNITVQMSDGVVAGFNCGQFSFVAATCHSTGTNKAQSVAPQYIDDGTGTMVLQPGYSNCTDTDADGIDDTCSFTGRIAYRGTSQGGSVGGAPLGDATIACSTGNIVNMVSDDLLATGDVSGTTQPPQN